MNIGYLAHSDELHLYLLSHPGSLHCLNLAANPSMAVAVFPSAQNWTDPGRGIQLFGACAQVADAEAPEAERVYGGRYPAYPAWKVGLKPSDRALEYRFYRFVPDRLKLLDEAEFSAYWEPLPTSDASSSRFDRHGATHLDILGKRTYRRRLACLLDKIEIASTSCRAPWIC